VLSYEHRWQFNPWWEIYYSVVLDRRVYDGERACAVALHDFVGMRHRRR
jgi:hypothetical protein